MYTTIKYLRGAAGIGLGTTIKYLRRTTSSAAGSSLGNMMKQYLRRTATHNKRRREQWPEHHDHSPL
jgi:hypothetical protein